MIKKARINVNQSKANDLRKIRLDRVVFGGIYRYMYFKARLKFLDMTKFDVIDKKS